MKQLFRCLRLPGRALCVAALATLTLAGAAAGQPLQIGYSFNEGTQSGSGGLLTDYYRLLDGAFTGTWSGDLYFRPGFTGEEGDFSITSGGNRVRADVSSVFGENWGSFTIEAHFTIGPEGGWRQIVYWEYADSYQPVLQKTSSNQLRTPLGGDIRTEPLPDDDQWHHAALVYDADEATVSLYLDGDFVGSGPTDTWVTPTNVYIAASHSGGGTWTGKLDDIRFTNAALTPDQFLREGFGAELTQPLPPVDPPPGADEWQFFWTELELGEIQTARGDGTDRQTLVTGLNRPISVQADPEGSFLYWSEDGVGGNTTGDGRISRSDLDGGNVTILYDATEGDAGLDNPQYIALNPAAGMIYWVEHQTGVYRAPLDGSGPVQEVYIASWERFTNLALDLVNDHLYFGNPQTGDLWRTDLEGNNYTALAWGLTDTWTFNGLAVDPQAGSLYYPDTGTVKSSDLTGSNAQTLATGLNMPLAVIVGPAGERLFFTERGGQHQIGTVNLDGTGQQPLITGLDSPFGLAVIQVAPPVSAPFEQWRQTHFDAAELEDSEISGPAATPAGDGIANLLKYALGLGDPKTPARDSLPMAEFVGGELQITYPRAAEATDVELFVEVSSDLLDWNSGEGYTEVIGIDDSRDPELVTVRILTSGDPGRLFIRLNAVQLVE